VGPGLARVIQARRINADPLPEVAPPERQPRPGRTLDYGDPAVLRESTLGCMSPRRRSVNGRFDFIV